MNEIIKEIENAQLKESVPAFEVGDTVRVHNRIQEGNKSRIQIFEGTVIKIQGGSNRQTWPIHSPNVADVEVVRKGKIRRAKLFYLRDRVGKKAKVKEKI